MTRRRRPIQPFDPAQLAEGERLVVQQVAQLTGVTRERLRTWERRHNFPEPERRANNVRTYAVSDIPRIVAVARLIDNGYPVGEAIASIVAGTGDRPELGDDGASLAHAPLPVIAVAREASGELHVAWSNAATRMHPEAHHAATDPRAWVQRIGDEALAAIDAMLGSTDDPAPQTLAHTDWVGTFPVTRHSLVWRTETADVPCVVLMQLPETMLTAEPSTTRPDDAASRWALAVAGGRQVLQDEGGLASAQHALRELVAASGALDGLLVLRHGAELRTASSVRGTVSARSLVPARCPDVMEAIGDGDLRWIDQASHADLGLPSYLAVLAVPLTITGHAIGVILLSFPQRLSLSEASGEVLQLFGLAVASVIERERGSSARPAVTTSTRMVSPPRVPTDRSAEAAA